MLAKGAVKVDDKVVFDAQHAVNQFSRIEVAGELVQNKTPRYVMLHKPKGYVSATHDALNPTVMDLIDESYVQELHIAGRLDINTTGLLLLTNDSRWSQSLTGNNAGVVKKYLVTTKDKIDYEQYRAAFCQGIYFSTEGITTKPAKLLAITERQAYLEITEGRYHQVKRMFGYFNNQVIGLHRERVGSISLSEDLPVGSYKSVEPDLHARCATETCRSA